MTPIPELAPPILEVPPALVERWRTRAPRYTSYPTAPHFHAVDDAALHAALGRGDGPLAVYVHVPFCRSLCHYCGCHVEIQGSRRDLGAGYVDTLLAELDLLVARLRPGRTVAQLSIGGGTPTFLYPHDMARLVAGLRARLPFAPDVDASLEIDPRTVDDDDLRALVGMGFNRYSFGVQDLDEAVVAAVHREQSAAEVVARVAAIRALGRFDLNLDLMYGLPHQTEAGFAATLDGVVALRPSRVALFQYAHVPWMKPAQKLVERQGLPDAALKTRLFVAANERFAAAGYAAIGMDHFALPEDALVRAQRSGTLQRNFMGYTTRAGLDLLPLGVSAIGSFGGMYAQNLKDRAAWSQRVAEGALPVERGHACSDDDLDRRRVIMALFCNFHVRFPLGAYAEERARLAPLESDGICVVHPDGVDITPLGRHFVRNVCSVFDAYLEADAGARRYSTTA